MLKIADFRAFYHVFRRAIFASVLCFFATISCSWAAEIHYDIFSGGDTVSCDAQNCPGLSSTCYSDYPNYSGQCSGTYTPGNAIILGIPTNSNPNHTFLGWKVSGSGCILNPNYPSYPSNGQYTLSGCSGIVSVQAVWQYGITYNLNKPVGVPSLSAITNQPSQNPQYVESSEQGIHLAGAPSAAGYTFLGWNCYDPNHQSGLTYRVGVYNDGPGDWPLNANGLYDGGAQVGYGFEDAECMAMWSMNNYDHEVVLQACYGNYNTPPVPTPLMFYRNTDTNYYLNYISGNFSNQITNSNPVVVPNSTCFAGYDADREYCVNSPQADSIQNFCVNSYGEIQSGMSSSYENLYATYLDPQYALKLDSSDADGGSHGTEFLWYCHDNGCNGGANGRVYGFVFNPNASSPQPQYSIDNFNTPLLPNNSSYHIDVPTRDGYTFAGYFDQSGTTRYINENGVVTSAGATALSNMNWNGSSCNVWYARWCNGDDQPIDADGTCPCPYGSIPDTLSTPFYDVEWGEAIGSYGVELDEETKFGDEEDKLLELVTAINSGEFGLVYANDNALLGAGLCTADVVNSPAKYAEVSGLVDTGDPESNKFCWCSLTGGVVNGMQYSLPDSQWVFLGDYSNEDCNKTCVSACASSGGMAEIFGQNWCIPETYKVEYYCGDDYYQHHIDDPNEPNFDPVDTDTVIDGATGYLFSSNAMDVTDQCQAIEGGHANEHVAGFKCFTTNSLASVYDNDSNPWNLDEDVYCEAQWEANGYTISLNKQGGSSGNDYVYTIYNTNVYKDSNRSVAMTYSGQSGYNSASNITVPTKSGAVFDGYWSTANGGVQYIDADGYITQNGWTAGKGVTNNNAVWYAHWLPTYGIQYVSQTVNSNTIYWTEPDVLAYGRPWSLRSYDNDQNFADWVAPSGYGAFLHWCTNADGSGDCYDPGVQPGNWDQQNSGLTVYAVYTPLNNTYTISYLPGWPGGVSGSGSMSDDGPYAANQSVTLSQNEFTADYHYVNGWVCKYANSVDVPVTPDNSTTPASYSITMPEGNVTCTAQWAGKPYDVIYKPGVHGSGTDYTDSATYGNWYGPVKSIGAVSISAESNAYVFAGWVGDYARANNTYDYTVTETFMYNIPGALTLTAQWDCASGYHWNSDHTACVNTYSVTYDCGGGGGTVPVDSTGYYSGDNVQLLSNTCQAPAHYTNPATWACVGDSTDTDVSQSNGYITMPGEDVTCYAKWTEVEYTVTYHRGNCGGSAATVTDTAAYGQSYNLFNRSQAGSLLLDTTCADFLGWSRSSGAITPDNGLSCSNGSCGTISFDNTTDTDFYAVCEFVEYRVIYHTGNCNGDGSSNYTDNSAIYGTPYTILGINSPNMTVVVPQNSAFQGWSTSENEITLIGDTYNLSLDSGTVCPKQLDLYAVCGPIEINLDWQLNGGLWSSGQQNQNSCIYGTSGGITVYDPAPRRGYSFDGWAIQDITNGG